MTDLVVVLDDWVRPGGMILVMPLPGERIISVRVVADTIRAVKALTELNRMLAEACLELADSLPGRHPGDTGESKARQASPDHSCPPGGALDMEPSCYQVRGGIVVHGPGCACV